MRTQSKGIQRLKRGEEERKKNILSSRLRDHESAAAQASPRFSYQCRSHHALKSLQRYRASL